MEFLGGRGWVSPVRQILVVEVGGDNPLECLLGSTFAVIKLKGSAVVGSSAFDCFHHNTSVWVNEQNNMNRVIRIVREITKGVA